MAKATTDPIELPPGWTTDPEDLAYDEDWAMDDCNGQMLCAVLQIGKGRPIMWNDPGYVLLFEANGKFYLWWRMGVDIEEIVSPADLDGIIMALKQKGFRGLKCKAL